MADRSDRPQLLLLLLHMSFGDFFFFLKRDRRVMGACSAMTCAPSTILIGGLVGGDGGGW